MRPVVESQVTEEVWTYAALAFRYNLKRELLQDIARYHLFQRHWVPLLRNCGLQMSCHVGNGLF